MQEVTLNAAEQRLARHLAKERLAFNVRVGSKNLRVDDRDDLASTLEGVAAEIAFCRIVNVFPDTGIGNHDHADAYTTEFGSVDVKTTKRLDGQLLALLSKRDKKLPDAYALMLGEFPTYRFAGWTTADELINDERIKDLGHGKTFVMAQADLFAYSGGGGHE